MWYEHGQTEQLINLNHILYIQKTKDRSSALLLTSKDGRFILLEYEDEAETCEAYQIIRSKVMESKPWL
jgi:hypothetical protein